MPDSFESSLVKDRWHGDRVFPADVTIECTCVFGSCDECRGVVDLSAFNFPFEFASSVPQSSEKDPI